MRQRKTGMAKEDGREETEDKDGQSAGERTSEEKAREQESESERAREQESESERAGVDSVEAEPQPSTPSRGNPPSLSKGWTAWNGWAAVTKGQ